MSSTEVETILGAMNSREIQVLKRLVNAQASVADNRYMSGIYLPNLEDRLERALRMVTARETVGTENGAEIDMKNENGVDYKIIFRSNERIVTIKFMRELWGYGLKEAKDISDLAWDDRFLENTLIVRNDTQFNMVNARSLIDEILSGRHRYTRAVNINEPFARIEAI